jgi:hypothetical protein
MIKRVPERVRSEPSRDSPFKEGVAAWLFQFREPDDGADSLGTMAQSSHATFAWIVLPARPDYLSAFTDRSRRWLRAAAGRRFLYLDLVQELKQPPPDSIDPMFLPPSAEFRAASPDAGGHYTERGNAWVADRIYQFLNTVPALSRRPSGHTSDPRDPTTSRRERVRGCRSACAVSGGGRSPRLGGGRHVGAVLPAGGEVFQDAKEGALAWPVRRPSGCWHSPIV